MLLKRLIDNRGVSLVELLIAVSLLAIVLGVGYNFFFFGAQAFKTGERQSNTQQAVRLAADFISNEIRYASSLDIIAIENVPNNFNTTTDDYYYLYNKNNQIYYRQPGESSGSALFGGLNADIDYGLNFKKGIPIIGTDSISIAFNISGSKAGLNMYSVDTEVIILNIYVVEGLQNAGAVKFIMP